MKKLGYVLTLLSILSICFTAFAAEQTADIDSAKHFFQQYTQRLAEHDQTVEDLYADNVVVSVARRYPEKLDKAFSVDDKMWKSLFGKSMAKGDKSPDQYTYSNIKITADKTKAKITADRYVVLGCYTDPEYYMVINKQNDGGYKIVEEYFEVHPMSFCKK